MSRHTTGLHCAERLELALAVEGRAAPAVTGLHPGDVLRATLRIEHEHERHGPVSVRRVAPEGSFA